MDSAPNTLVLNCGSSSLKYRLLDRALQALAGGLVECLGTPEATHLHWSLAGGGADAEPSGAWPPPTPTTGAHAPAAAQPVGAPPAGARASREACPDIGIEAALARVATSLGEQPAADVVAHRIVHGGTVFVAPAIIDAPTMRALRDLAPLAPLHMPAALRGIEAAQQAWPAARQVAVFDTAFHAHLPPEAAHYAVPAEWQERLGVRRYGFHGHAHASALRAAAALLGRKSHSLDLITLHLGSGASMSAIRHGVCVETSMGFTPLEGLVMGTRSGDIDPALPLWLLDHAGLTAAEVERMLLSESGLKGLCGDADMRRVCARAESGDPRAEAALGLYCHRIRKYLGAYAAVLGHLDAIVFSGGVGENAASVRERICSGLGILGIGIDPAKNRSDAPLPRAIHAASSSVEVLVVKSDEEREIARAAAALRTAR